MSSVSDNDNKNKQLAVVEVVYRKNYVQTEVKDFAFNTSIYFQKKK